MAFPTKIATCCYCGTRAALVLRGAQRHELACSSCGAPLHNLKMLPKHRRHDREPVRGAVSHQPRPEGIKKKKRKSRWSRFGDILEDAFDIIEDILD
ncbi:MAG: hypothetical protein AAFY39_17250 [Pseudomonadota bacterium]